MKITGAILAIPLFIALILLGACATVATTGPGAMCAVSNYQKTWETIVDGLIFVDEVIGEYQDKPQPLNPTE